MAKLSGPLLSFGASGSIADTVTFTKRKKQNVAKSHAIPQNPNSSAQAAQRSVISQSNAIITQAFAAQLSSHKQQAKDGLNLWAKCLGLHRTWYNQALSNVSSVILASNTPAVITALWGVNQAGVDYFKANCLQVNGVDITNATCKYGISPCSLIYSGACGLATGPHDMFFAPPSLISGVRYFFQFVVDHGENCAGVMSGIGTYTVP